MNMATVNPQSGSMSGGAAAVAPAREVQTEVPKQIGYGLPCAKCKTYYAADLKACPVCKSPERVTAKTISAPPVSASNDPDAVALEEERERFLREFKAQVYASH